MVTILSSNLTATSNNNEFRGTESDTIMNLEGLS